MRASNIALALWRITRTQYSIGMPTTELVDVLQRSGMQNLSARNLLSMLQSLAVGGQACSGMAVEEKATAEAENNGSEASEDSESGSEGSDESGDAESDAGSEESGGAETAPEGSEASEDDEAAPNNQTLLKMARLPATKDAVVEGLAWGEDSVITNTTIVKRA